MAERETQRGQGRAALGSRLQGHGRDIAPGRYRLITLRSNDQFNTTIYGYSDRLRGIEGIRDVQADQVVSLVSDADDGVCREVSGLKVVPYTLPDGCVASYYPECNPLVPLAHHDLESKTLATKAVPVRIVPSGKLA